jgi:aldehyde:ferredoxin oxidoreductase
MKGWQGKVLWVNLSEGTVKEDALDPTMAKDYIGGRGFGIYFLNKYADPTIDPLSPENPLIMASGPLTGTGAPTGARYMVMTKSPLTGAITCSNSGGIFPTEFKRTG